MPMLGSRSRLDIPATRRSVVSFPVFGIIALCLSLAAPTLAQDDRFEFHGFLNQAWATGDFASGPLTDALGSPQESELLIGIPEDGTTDYRSLAIQFRYEISDNDIMVVQLSNQATGISPIDDFRDEVELDWAFYERRIGSETSLKVGRVQIPLGIFNEVRDVGTILPFFRPAYAIYNEGSFTSETVDGLALSHIFAADSPWSLEVDVYAGEYEAFEVPPTDPSLVAEVDAKDAYGINLWLNTPIDGLRVGTSFHTRKLEGGLEGIFRQVGEEQDIEDFWVSIDGVFERFIARAEYREFEPEIPSFLGTGNSITLGLSAWYAQLGWIASDTWHVYLQYEKQLTDQSSPDFVSSVDFDNRTDIGLSVNYFFSPSLVLKAEYHEVELEAPVAFPVFGPTGPLIGSEVLDADDGNYFIVSLATSF